jgi:hypothetical protein
MFPCSGNSEQNHYSQTQPIPNTLSFLTTQRSFAFLIMIHLLDLRHVALFKKRPHRFGRQFWASSFLAHYPFSCYIYPMTIEQTVEVPANHRIFLDIPPQIPAGRVILTFTPAPKCGDNSLTADPGLNRKPPISRYFGILSPHTYGDAVAYQRTLRDEWDD